MSVVILVVLIFLFRNTELIYFMKSLLTLSDWGYTHAHSKTKKWKYYTKLQHFDRCSPTCVICWTTRQEWRSSDTFILSFVLVLDYLDYHCSIENGNFYILFSTGSHFRLLEQQKIVFLPYTRTWHCTALIKKLSGEAVSSQHSTSEIVLCPLVLSVFSGW